jgi:hypothetical protein
MEFETAIHAWFEHRGQDLKSWTSKAKPILASHRKAKALAIVKPGCR